MSSGVNPSFDMPLAPQEAPGKRAALIMAVVVHTVLLIFLVYGIRWQTQTPEAESVSVELVRAGPAAKAQPAPQPQAEPEPPPPPKPVTKAEPRPEPKAEPKPLAKPDIAVKEKEKPEPEKKPNLLDKFLNKEMEQINKTSRNTSVTSALDKEIAQSKASQAAAANAKSVADYMGRIRGKIRGNLILPPDVRGNPEAIFDVTQLPSGEVLSIKLRKSSGSSALDAAIERAILKSSPLPKPERGELFSRDLELKFRPLDD